ncbi:MAG TPA: hypothetical protein VFP98_02880 [Candidatus Polarisedimenticolia bacterium]|nr:hypothetical protein [Candidatus Polarisedimenticolia bacterium]
MRLSRHGGLAIVAAAALLAGGLQAWAVATAPALAGGPDDFSPLFGRRLEVGHRNMDKPPGRVFVAAYPQMYQPVETPFSGNPASGCLGSACYLSVCIGSACIGSRCLGSACITSGCGGSGCVSSGCGGSACVGSACGGSACVGSICAGSACTFCGAEGLQGHRRG